MSYQVDEPAVLVVLLEGKFHENPVETLRRAAELAYDTLMAGQPGWNALHSIRQNNKVVWEYGGLHKSLATLFRIMYPEGADRAQRG